MNWQDKYIILIKLPFTRMVNYAGGKEFKLQISEILIVYDGTRNIEMPKALA